MAETLEDDDMILLIVGDEEVPVKDENYQKDKIDMPSSIDIKQEPLDESENTATIGEIIQQAAEHGEYMHINPENDEYYFESLEEDDSAELTPENDSIKHGFDLNAANNGYPLQNRMNLPTKRRYRMLMQGQRKSFVQQLRKEYPEMEKNPTLLVEHLAGIMRELKPPPLPPIICKVVYDADDNLKFECCTCKAHKDSLASASRHYQEKHGKRYLKCFACGADFRGTTNLYKHEKRCQSEDARVVLKARGRFLGRKGRGRPFLTPNRFADRASPGKGRTPRLYCAKCPASFVYKQNLVAHENSHEGLRPYRCDTCPAAYTSETGLKRHLQTHSDSQFVCDHCGRTFKFKHALVAHLDTHKLSRKYGCSLCSRRFAQKNALQHHTNREHLNLPPAYGCPVCPKRYARLSHVKDHLKKQHELEMMTRKMFFKALPTMSDIEIKTARVVFNSEISELTHQSPFIPEFKPKKERVKKIKDSIEKEIEEKTETYRQNVYQMLQEEHNKNGQSGQKVYELVLDNEENAEMMNEFLQYIQSTVEPGKMIKIQKGVYNKNNEVEVLP